jgi:hypothetical protein
MWEHVQQGWRGLLDAKGSVADITTLKQRLAALEAKPAPLTTAIKLVAGSQDSYYTECVDQSGTFIPGACAVWLTISAEI